MLWGRWNTTNLSPGDLIPLLCGDCGLPLHGGDDAAVFMCTNCGSAHEMGESGLVRFFPLTATVSTELAIGGAVRYLAFWRLTISVSAGPESAWERIRRVAAPDPAYLFVPAFSLMRAVVQRLGVGLSEAQPALQLTQGLESRPPHRPALADTRAGAAPSGGGIVGQGDGALGAAPGEPDFGPLSPVLVGRHDARTLGHFVYLAIESHESRDLHSVDYRLETTGEDLLFIPAVWDPRCIHGSNWRLLLREFDGLVA